MSDDGEPSGTAGMPMLKVLEYSSYGDIVVAAVRYFGGVKLGTGGLQRAYSAAVSQGLSDLPTKWKVSRTILKLVYDYAYESPIKHLLGSYDLEFTKWEYTEQIDVCIAVPFNDEKRLRNELLNITSNNIEISVLS
jgi:uncharacterized YigZ family protein